MAPAEGSWETVDGVADGIAGILEIEAELVGIMRAGPRVGSASLVVLTEAQARRLAVLAGKGKVAGV